MNVITIRTPNGNALVIGPRMAVTSQRVQRIAKRLKNINNARQARAERDKAQPCLARPNTGKNASGI